MAIFDEKNEIRERCKGVHCVDLGESFPTSIYLQKSASIQPSTSPSKFGEKYSILFTGVLNRGGAVSKRAAQKSEGLRNRAAVVDVEVRDEADVDVGAGDEVEVPRPATHVAFKAGEKCLQQHLDTKARLNCAIQSESARA